MAQYVRRRVASIQLSIAAAALGLLAGIGLGRGTEPPPTVDAEPAAKRTLTISGANIVDGSIKYQDLNKASIQKGIYLKTQVNRLFLKLTEADARFNKVITNALGSYIKLGDADTRYLKLDALNGYLKLTDADARFLKHDALDSYIKLDTADGRFLKLDALNGYLKIDAADARFLKIDVADARYLKLGALDGYVKLTDADARFLKLADVGTRFDKHLTDNGYLKLTDADGRFLKLADVGTRFDKHLTDNGYLKLTDADGRFLKIDDVDARIDKHLTANGYIKGSEADARYVEGDGSIVTGSRLVEDSPEPLLTIDRTLSVEASHSDKDGSALVKLVNLTDTPLTFASTAIDENANPQAGTIAPKGIIAILIGLRQPATVQVVGSGGDGAAVHTLNVSAHQIGGKLQVVGQALSGAPREPAG